MWYNIKMVKGKAPSVPVKVPAASPPAEFIETGGYSMQQKIGYSLIGVSLAALGFGVAARLMNETEDENTKKIISAVSAFWITLIFGLTRAYVWGPDLKEAERVKVATEAQASRKRNEEDSEDKLSKTEDDQPQGKARRRPGRA
uniref:Uncharacterized protein n=1 Tax=Polytomella parva TaxID=51329 RepID=A0A7S0V947_9CHLO